MKRKRRDYLRVVWNNMKYRCYNINCPSYPNYGGKGVIVCPEWKDDFVAFSTWALSNGWKKGLQIDKDIIANQLGVKPLIYSPERCQIVTQKANIQNQTTRMGKPIYTLIEYNGITKSISEWANELNISRNVLSIRIHRLNWTAEKAFTTKTRFKKPPKT
jgi:hypothetical protein